MLIAEQYAREELRIRVVRISNFGIAHAQPGRENLLILDQDAELETSARATIIAGLEMHPKAGAAYFRSLSLMLRGSIQRDLFL